MTEFSAGRGRGITGIPKESELSSMVLGPIAADLIATGRDKLREQPEFARALANAYLSVIPGEMEAMTLLPVSFKRGELYIYSVKHDLRYDSSYRDLVTGMNFRMERLPISEDKGEQGSCIIDLTARKSPRSAEFTSGTLHYVRHFFRLFDESDNHSNTQTAADKVREFLANF